MIKMLSLLFVFLCRLLWPEMFVSPLKFIVRCLILSVMVFRTEEFGRWLGCEGGALMRGISALMRGDIEEFVSSLSALHCGKIWKVSNLQSRQEPVPRHDHADTPVLDFQHLELWEIKFCCLSATHSTLFYSSSLN